MLPNVLCASKLWESTYNPFPSKTTTSLPLWGLGGPAQPPQSPKEDALQTSFRNPPVGLPGLAQGQPTVGWLNQNRPSLEVLSLSDQRPGPAVQPGPVDSQAVWPVRGGPRGRWWPSRVPGPPAPRPCAEPEPPPARTLRLRAAAQCSSTQPDTGTRQGSHSPCTWTACKGTMVLLGPLPSSRGRQRGQPAGPGDGRV